MTVPPFPWIMRNRAKLSLALRMIVAATLAYTLAKAFGLAQGYWAVLTTIIVTQNSVGGSLKAAMDRLVGSLCGALVGAIAAILVPSHTPIMLGLALVASIAPLAVLTAFHPNYRIAPVTAIIVLMGTSTATLGPFGYAFDRVMEIAIGSVIGVVVALIAPVRAHVQLCQAAAETTSLLAETMVLLASAVGTGAPPLDTLPARIQATLNRLGTSAEEAARERRSRLSDHPDPEPLFRTLRRLQQDILALNRLFGTPWPEAAQATLSAPWSSYAQAVAATLRALAASLSTRTQPTATPPPRDTLDAFLAAIETLRREGALRVLPTDLVGSILGSAFRVQQLQRDLGDLTERVQEIAPITA